MDEDKYPPASGRRQFVKGIVGGSVLGALGTASSAAVGTTTNRSGVGGGSVQAMAIENTDGPANGGMVQIPVEIEDGYLKGIWPDTVEDSAAVTTLGGVRYSSKWFQDCGVQSHPGLGKPATATWRSVEAEGTTPVQVIRSPEIERQAENDEWLAASTDRGFIAWLNKCTHLCCVPSGFKQTARVEGAANNVYCQCHQSIYDPFSVVSTVFPAKPRPEN
jgi:Rieske Fe-S protein